jgi:hypothetical protein
LQFDYFETILHIYLTQTAHEALKSLRELLLEKATDTVKDSSESVGHNRRQTRGSEDGLVLDERQQGTIVSPDDLIVREHLPLLDYSID